MPSTRSWTRLLWPFSVRAPEVDLTGTTAVVTLGASAGLGYATCEQFIKNKLSTLVIAANDISQGGTARTKLLDVAKSLNLPEPTIHVWQLDLASFDSVIAFHKQVAQLQEIHIFVGIGGAFSSPEWTLTQDGWEEAFQTNVLSTGLLAHLILGELARTAEQPKCKFKPHMVLVSSEGNYDAEYAQNSAPKIIDALNEPFSYTDPSKQPLELYNISQLLVIQIAKELATLPAAANVNINSCCPGLYQGNPVSKQAGSGLAKYLLDTFAWSPEYAARTIFYSVTATTTPGAYIQDCTETDPNPFVLTEEGRDAQTKVWQELVKLWIKKDGDVRLLEASAP